MKEQRTSKTTATTAHPVPETREPSVGTETVCGSVSAAESGFPELNPELIISMMIIRRFECVLSKTKNFVLNLVMKDPSVSSARLSRAAGRGFYNVSSTSLAEICVDEVTAADSFLSYIGAFSSNVREILDDLGLPGHVKQLAGSGKLCDVIRFFAGFDFSPDRIDSFALEKMLRSVERRVSENESE